MWYVREAMVTEVLLECLSDARRMARTTLAVGCSSVQIQCDVHGHRDLSSFLADGGRH